jgi:hypothetical protein
MDGSVCPVREDALGLLSLRHGPKLFSADVAQSSWIALMRPRYLHNYSAAQRPPHRRHGDRVVRVGNRRARRTWVEDREWRAWTLSLPLLETAGRDLSTAVPPVASYHTQCSATVATVATVKVVCSSL